jgi:hypothetical protein
MTELESLSELIRVQQGVLDATRKRLRAEILSRMSAGTPGTTIAKECGVSHQRIYTLLKEIRE